MLAARGMVYWKGVPGRGTYVRYPLPKGSSMSSSKLRRGATRRTPPYELNLKHAVNLLVNMSPRRVVALVVSTRAEAVTNLNQYNREVPSGQ